MKHFYGVYLRDEPLSLGIDVVRFLGQPDAIRFTHITLRGPYVKRALNDREVADLNYGIASWSVRIGEPGLFWNDDQSTVYLRVDLRELKRLWYKPDFPTGTPHITLYDGDDANFATRLHEIVSQHDWSTNAPVRKMQYIESKAVADPMTATMLRKFTDVFGHLLGSTQISPLDVKLLPTSARLSLIQKAIVKMGVPLAPRRHVLAHSEARRRHFSGPSKRI